MRKHSKGKGKIALSVALGAVMCLSVSLPGVAALAAEAGKYYSDYTTRDEALAAARDLNERLSEEGSVLLKNQNSALPLNGNEKVSVFGIAQGDIEGGTGNVADMLAEQGFNVNPTLANYYKQVGSGNYGAEKTEADMTGAVKSSLDIYNDVAVIFVCRAGAEGADLSMNTGEEATEEENIGGWTHEALSKGDDGKTYKHELMLTDAENSLIEYVGSKNFKKVVFVLSTANIIEMYNVEHNENIDAVLSIGRPGNTGLAALGRILAGEVNPSGRLVDQYMTDFSADPTWQNFADNSQTGSDNSFYFADGTKSGEPNSGASGRYGGYHMVEYEEDIYMGYRYYETMYYEMQQNANLIPEGYETADEWFDAAVVYPFGYGLSYTTFTYSDMAVYVDEDCTTPVSEATAADFASNIGSPAKYDKLYVKVTVNNTGDYAGKEVVQIYATAPYTPGETEKSHVVLAGFGKTDILRAGKSETITVEVNVQDIASYDATDKDKDQNKGYELDAGEYVLRAMASSHVDETAAYDEVTFNLAEDANLKLDDYTGNLISNLFSAENGENYSLRDNTAAYTGDYKINSDASLGTKLMTRADMRSSADGTIASFPVSPTLADLTITEAFEFYAPKEDDLNDVTLDGTVIYSHFDADTLGSTDAEKDQPWYITKDEFDAEAGNWTQSIDDNFKNPSKDTAKHDYLLADMAGIDPDGQEVIQEGVWKGKTGEQAWETFMNQLTWEELVYLQSGASAGGPALQSIGLAKFSAADSPNSFAGYTWCCESVIAQTYNVELAEEQGKVVGNLGVFNGNNGWNGPGMNIHRTPFGGRNNDYYSQDGLQGGYIAAAVVKGAESKGLSCFVKHCFLNDQETDRDNDCLFTFVSEQAIREIYAKNFQMAIQEGGASGIMSAFNRIGRIPAATNWSMVQGLIRNEWGSSLRCVTDMWSGEQAFTPLDLQIRASHDMPYGSGSANDPTQYKKGAQVSGVWDATLRNGKGGVVCGSGEDEYESYLQYYFVRTAVQRVLVCDTNSVVNKNGIDMTAYSLDPVTAKQGDAVNVDIAMDAAALNGATEVSYTATNLPAGLTISGTKISGTLSAPAGEYKVTVTAVCDNFYKVNATLNITVGSGFTYDQAVFDAAKQGEFFEGIISSQNIVTGDDAYKTVTYSVAEGSALPAGLSITENGIIEGTPEVSGDFTTEILVTATQEVSSGGRRPTITTKTYEFTTTVTFKIAAGEPVEEAPPFEIGDNGNWFIDGEDTGVPATGPAGPQGPQGEQGATGATGPAGADGKGCGSSIAPAVSAAGAVVLAAAAGLCLIVRRKKEN